MKLLLWYLLWESLIQGEDEEDKEEMFQLLDEEKTENVRISSPPCFRLSGALWVCVLKKQMRSVMAIRKTYTGPHLFLPLTNKLRLLCFWNFSVFFFHPSSWQHQTTLKQTTLDKIHRHWFNLQKQTLPPLFLLPNFQNIFVKKERNSVTLIIVNKIYRVIF